MPGWWHRKAHSHPGAYKAAVLQTTDQSAECPCEHFSFNQSLLSGKSSPWVTIHLSHRVKQLWSDWAGNIHLTRLITLASGSLGQKTFSKLTDLQIFVVKTIKYLQAFSLTKVTVLFYRSFLSQMWRQMVGSFLGKHIGDKWKQFLLRSF